MRRRRRIEHALNLATMTMLGVALVIWARSTLGEGADPLVRETADSGELPDSASFEALASGDTLRMRVGGPALYLVFRSTCPACGRNLRFWRGIISRLPDDVQAFAVALEGRRSGLSYAQLHLAEALGVRPLEVRGFVRQFGIRGLPTTLLVDAAGRIRIKRTGVLDEESVEEVVRLAATVSSR